MNGINGGHPSVAGPSGPAAQQQPAPVDGPPAPPSAARDRDTSPLPPGKRARSSTPQPAELAPRGKLPLPAELIASIGRSLSGPQSRPDLLNLSLTSRTAAAALHPQRVAAQLSHRASTTDTLERFEKLLAETFGPIDAAGSHLPDDLKAEVLVEVFKVVEMLPQKDMLAAIGVALKTRARLPAALCVGPAIELAKSVNALRRNQRSVAFQLIGGFIRDIPAAMRAEPMTELFRQIEGLPEFEEIIEAMTAAMKSIAEIPQDRRRGPLLAVLKQLGLMNDDVHIPEKLEQAIELVDSIPAHDRPPCLHEMSVASSYIEDAAITEQAKDRILECMRRFAVDSASRPPAA